MKAFKFVSLAADLPPYMSRSQVSEYLPGIGLGSSHLANLASRGEGPPYAKLSGKTAFYETIKLLEWLDRQVVPVQFRPQNSTGHEELPLPSTRRRGRPRKEDEVRFRQGGSL